MPKHYTPWSGSGYFKSKKTRVLEALAALNAKARLAHIAAGKPADTFVPKSYIQYATELANARKTRYVKREPDRLGSRARRR